MDLRALVLAMAAAASGCSFLVKSDDLIGGGSAPGAADASTGNDDAAGGGTPGGSDGGTSAGCPAGYACDDFEGAGTIPWAVPPQTTGNATIGVDGVKPRSGKRSLHAVRPVAPSRDTAMYIYPLRAFPRACEFDAFVTSSTTDSVSFFEVSFDQVDPPNTSYSVSMEMGGGLSQYAARSSGPSVYTSQHVDAFALGRWVHVAVSFVWSGASPSMDLTVDGAAVPSFPLTPPTHPPAYAAFGILYLSQAGLGAEAFVDNVRCAME